MINKESKEYGIIVTTLMFIGFLIIVVVAFKNLDIESETQTSYMPSEKRVLAVGEPKYVDFDDIKSDDEYIKRDDNSKYSQINIKNISDNTLYNISINLREQEMNEKASFMHPSYFLSSLKSGESAILSFQHNDLKENQELKIESYTYRDGNEKLCTVNNIDPSDTSDQGVYIETDKKRFKYNKITNDIDKITIEDIKNVEVDGKNYLNIDIKNNSEVELADVSLNFKEYHENIVVGEKSQRLENNLKSKEKTTISVEVKNELKLELEDYSYSIIEENDNKKYNKCYTVFINEGKYNLEEYEGFEESRRRSLVFSIISFVCATIMGILDIFYNKLEKKIELEENEAYQDKGKVIKRIKMVIFIIYTIFAIYSIFII